MRAFVFLGVCHGNPLDVRSPIRTHRNTGIAFMWYQRLHALHTPHKGQRVMIELYMFDGFAYSARQYFLLYIRGNSYSAHQLYRRGDDPMG